MNYSELVTDIQQWCEDDSTEFTDAIPDIIARAEDRIFTDVPRLLHNRQVQTGNMSIGNRQITVGTIPRRIKSFQITSSGAEKFLRKVESSFIDTYTPSSSTQGTPKYYCQVDDNDFIFAPTPNEAYAYTLRYWGTPARLTSSNTTTTLGTMYPNLMLKASLYESGIFLQMEEETVFPMWKLDYEQEAAKVASEVETSYSEDNLRGA